MDINSRDRANRTPLHLAALEGREQSCTVLIALTTNFEMRDNDGFTPLHLAAISGNYRIVRHLIMRGASRESLSPQYTAEGIGKIMTIPEEVQELLRPISCIDKFNIVRPPLDIAKNSISTFLLNIFIFLFRYAITILII